SSMSSISPLSRTIACLLAASFVALPIPPGVVHAADAPASATPAPKSPATPATPAPAAAKDAKDSKDTKDSKEAPPTIVPTNLFAVPEGLEVTVWATTPLLHNPTNIDIDKDGRVWVAEGVNYRSKANRQPGGDKIVILEDTTGAGRADKSTVFVQDPDLVAP